jgi:formate dehydrogenase
LLGTVENKLGIAEWLREQGHEYVCLILVADSRLIVTDDKEGPDSEFQKHIVDVRTAKALLTPGRNPHYNALPPRIPDGGFDEKGEKLAIVCYRWSWQ